MNIEYYDFKENFINFYENIALNKKEIILLGYTVKNIYTLNPNQIDSNSIIKIDNNDIPRFVGLTKSNSFRLIDIEKGEMCNLNIFGNNEFITCQNKLDSYNNVICFGSSKGNLLIYDLRMKNICGIFEAHNKYIHDIQPNIKDGFMYTCGEDQFLKKWNLYNNNCYETYIGFNKPIISRIKIINQILFFSCLDSTISIKNEQDNKEYISLTKHKNDKHLIDFCVFRNNNNLSLLIGSETPNLYLYNDITQNDSVEISTKFNSIELLYKYNRSVYFASRYNNKIAVIKI